MEHFKTFGSPVMMGSVFISGIFVVVFCLLCKLCCEMFSCLYPCLVDFCVLLFQVGCMFSVCVFGEWLLAFEVLFLGLWICFNICNLLTLLNFLFTFECNCVLVSAGSLVFIYFLYTEYWYKIYVLATFLELHNVRQLLVAITSFLSCLSHPCCRSYSPYAKILCFSI